MIRYILVSSNLESLRTTDSYQESRTVRLQPVLHDARRMSWGAVLIEDEAMTSCVTTLPIVVTSIICSKGLFPSLYPYLSTKTAYFQDIIM